MWNLKRTAYEVHHSTFSCFIMLGKYETEAEIIQQVRKHSARNFKTYLGK